MADNKHKNKIEHQQLREATAGGGKLVCDPWFYGEITICAYSAEFPLAHLATSTTSSRWTEAVLTS